MKIRNGFVSNSSSSSFLIYGIILDDKWDKFLEKLDLTDDEKFQLEENGQYYLSQIIYNKDLDGLEYINAYDGEYHYLGKSWDSVGDNETGGDFKKSIENKISKILGEKVKCSTISEAWSSY